MKKKPKKKGARHLQQKILLYENFLFRYLPQLSSLSFITRLNLFDHCTIYGLNRLGSQGTPFVIYRALHKQRQHQLKHQQSLKPFSFTLISPPSDTLATLAFDALQQANQLSSSCKLSQWKEAPAEGLKKLALQIQKQVQGEKNLLLFDPTGFPLNITEALRTLLGRKIELALFLPLKALWHLHLQPEKEPEEPAYRLLKQSIDQLFSAEHLYWSKEITAAEFCHFLKEGFRMNGRFYTALETKGGELPESALLCMSSDAFMMEKMLQSLHNVTEKNLAPTGQQLGFFISSSAPPVSTDTSVLKVLLQEEKDNRQLYHEGLQAGLLPSQLMEGLQQLLMEQWLEVTGEKAKPLPQIPPNCIGYTAYKAGKAACFFRKKD